MTQQTKRKSRKIWRQPWGYTEGVIIVSGMLITGFALDFITKTPIPKPAFPLNISLIVLLISVLAVLRLYRRQFAFVRWLSSVPAAVSALGAFTLISVMMGLIPQKNLNYPGFENLLDSWAYLLSYFYLLVVLGLSALKRIKPLKWKNTGYLLNHCGLWIALAAAGFGAGDVQQYNMYLQEGKTTWYAYDAQKQSHDLPFALKLNDFVLENYPAKIALIKPGSRDIYQRNGKPLITDLPLKKSQQMAGYKISTVEYLPYSIPDGLGQYSSSQDTGAVQAALIRIDEKKRGWVSPGNFRYPMQPLIINDSAALAMLKPEAKRYASEVTILTPNGTRMDAIIEVNKPLNIKGWNIYQSDYDQRYGRWSQLSVLELVKDPWLPYVYVGLVMMMLGAVWLIFRGKPVKK